MGQGFQIWNACAGDYVTVRAGCWSGVLGLSEDDYGPGPWSGLRPALWPQALALPPVGRYGRNVSYKPRRGKAGREG